MSWRTVTSTQKAYREALFAAIGANNLPQTQYLVSVEGWKAHDFVTINTGTVEMIEDAADHAWNIGARDEIVNALDRRAKQLSGREKRQYRMHDAMMVNGATVPLHGGYHLAQGAVRTVLGFISGRGDRTSTLINFSLNDAVDLYPWVENPHGPDGMLHPDHAHLKPQRREFADPDSSLPMRPRTPRQFDRDIREDIERAKFHITAPAEDLIKAWVHDRKEIKEIFTDGPKAEALVQKVFGGPSDRPGGDIAYRMICEHLGVTIRPKAPVEKAIETAPGPDPFRLSSPAAPRPDLPSSGMKERQ